GLRFTVDHRVLIPRPETETLVDAARELIAGRVVTVADVGTGSGAVAVAIAAHEPTVHVIATDISVDALVVARENTLRNGVADRIELREGDLLAPIAEPVDLVVANLPYLRDDTLEHLVGERTSLAFGPRMLELERQEWGKRAFSPREMRWQATNRDAVVMTTWDGPSLIGFAVAGPAWTEGRVSLLNVLIDPAYRGQGLVWPLIAAVERELFARGIRELEIDARVDNGFADNLEHRYGSRATVIEQDHPSPYGLQRTI